MKKYYFLSLLLLASGLMFAQSTYTGNLSFSDDSFFKYIENSSPYYSGSCNTFPIGSFIKIDLPYSDDSINVKIVSKSPQNGTYVVVDNKAAAALNLDIEDVIKVTIQVLDYFPQPLDNEELTMEMDPEPEIKGYAAKYIESDSKDDLVLDAEVTITADNVDPIITEESPVIEEALLDDDLELPAETDDSSIVEEPVDLPATVVGESEDLNVPVILETEAEFEATAAKEEPIIDMPYLIEESDVIEKPVIDKYSDVTLESIPSDDSLFIDNVATVNDAEIAETPEVVSEPDANRELSLSENMDLVKGSVKVTEPTETDEPKVYTDELPTKSMFDADDSVVVESSAEVEVKKLPTVTPKNKVGKKIFYLEPANAKPPKGGTPDEKYVPVTKVEDNNVFEDGYYLQVGLYTNNSTASEAAKILDSYNFPNLQVKEEKASERNILLVGPLKNDELGVIMLHLKSRGFEDFFRYQKKTDK